MADIKWIKIVTDIFDDEKILMIESLPNADNIIVIWFKLLCLAGKSNNSGVFMLNDKIPYTDEMLAAIFRRDLNIVRIALKTFEDFGMIEKVNNVVTIPNWSKHQTLDAYERKKERDRIYQANRRKNQRLLAEKSSDKSFEKSSDNNIDVVPLEREEEKEEEKELDIDINKYIEKWNSLGLNKVVKITKKRLSALKARINEYSESEVLSAMDKIKESSFLQGENDKGWMIDFDWLFKPNNFIKVLEDKYKDNKPISKSGSNFNNFKPREHTKRYEYLQEQILLGQATDEEKEEFEKLRGVQI